MACPKFPETSHPRVSSKGLLFFFEDSIIMQIINDKLLQLHYFPRPPPTTYSYSWTLTFQKIYFNLLQ